jgi:hypothetical protein
MRAHDAGSGGPVTTRSAENGYANDAAAAATVSRNAVTRRAVSP